MNALTWRQLDEATGNMLEDMDYYGYADLEQNDQLDEPIWDCIWIDQIMECLHQEYNDMPSNYDGEMLENEMLRKAILTAAKGVLAR